MTPRGRAIFGPREIILNKLGRGPLGDATYQISRLYALWFLSDKKIFFMLLPYISQCETSDPLGGAIFGPRDIIWPNLVEVY